MSGFKKAQRKQAKLRVAFAGPPGSGKTWAALTLGTSLARKFNTRVALIDTEHDSASLYSDKFDFDSVNLDKPYTPEKYIHWITESEKTHGVTVIDSTTHEWSGSGGCLEINEALAQAKYKGNTWSAFNETTPRHRKFIDAIISSKNHMICTVRSKVETVQQNGKVIKIGMKEEQRDGLEYEFTTVFQVQCDTHKVFASKDRTGLFSGRDPFIVNDSIADELYDWLMSGSELKPIVDGGAYISCKNELEDCRGESLDKLKEVFGRIRTRKNEMSESEMAMLVSLKDEIKAEFDKGAQDGQ